MSLDLSATATRLLSTLGSPDYVSIKKVTGRTFDPVTGLFSGGTTTETDLIAAVTTVTELTLSNQNSADNRVQVGDKVVMADKTIEPFLEDIIIIPDDSGIPIEYRIIQIGGSNHAGIRQVYRIVCRA